MFVTYLTIVIILNFAMGFLLATLLGMGPRSLQDVGTALETFSRSKSGN